MNVENDSGIYREAGAGPGDGSEGPRKKARSHWWILVLAVATAVLLVIAGILPRIQARTAYDESVASYRQTVLTAFQEVEDNLAVLRILNDEAQAQQAAVAAAEHSLDLSTNRYKGGVVSYLEVTTAQSTALADERAAVDILRRRMTASVSLIKALGGGWSSASLPASVRVDVRPQTATGQ